MIASYSYLMCVVWLAYVSLDTSTYECGCIEDYCEEEGGGERAREGSRIEETREDTSLRAARAASCNNDLPQPPTSLSSFCCNRVGRK